MQTNQIKSVIHQTQVGSRNILKKWGQLVCKLDKRLSDSLSSGLIFEKYTFYTYSPKVSTVSNYAKWLLKQHWFYVIKEDLNLQDPTSKRRIDND